MIFRVFSPPTIKLFWKKRQIILDICWKYSEESMGFRWSRYFYGIGERKIWHNNAFNSTILEQQLFRSKYVLFNGDTTFAPKDIFVRLLYFLIIYRNLQLVLENEKVQI